MLTKRLHITGRQNSSMFDYLRHNILLRLCGILYLHLIFMLACNLSLLCVNERQNKYKELMSLETLLINIIVLSNKSQ